MKLAEAPGDCPNCGYPSKGDYKGIYTPGEPCGGCGQRTAAKTPCPSCQYPNYKPGAPCAHCGLIDGKPAAVTYVRVERSDGTVIDLTDPAGCRQWDEVVSSQASFAHVHGVELPPLPWRERKTVDGYCCARMKEQLTQEPCRHHFMPETCPNRLIVERRRIFGTTARFIMPIHDGGQSYFAIYYCPFCGKKLETDHG